jgi:hypothetical protein
MPSGTEEYRGYTISWDVSSSRGSSIWTIQAGIVGPPDASGVPSTIHRITADRASSEAEARDYLLRAAKEWVDSRLHGSEQSEKSS